LLAPGAKKREKTRKNVWCLASAVFAVRVLHIVFGGLTYEDAYISLRYASNLAAGHGLVYNPGEPVFGATTPLYVLLLSLFAMLGAPAPLLAGKLMAALADAITAGLWYRALRRKSDGVLPGLAFAAMFGLSPFIVEVSVSGMETSLVLLGLTGAFLSVERRRPWLTGALLGFLALLRLDTLPAALILWIAAARRRKQMPWIEAGVAITCFLPWALFAIPHYGSPVPNSIPAKLAAYQAHHPSTLPNLYYSLSFIAPFRNGWQEDLFNAVTFPLFLAGLIRILRRDRKWWPLPALFLAHALFLVLSRTVLFRWYFPPVLLPYYVIAAYGVGPIHRREHLDSRSDGVRREEPLPSIATARDRRPSGSKSGGLSRGIPDLSVSSALSAVRARFLPCLVALLALHASYWLWRNIERARRLQAVEGRTRVAIGRWLAEHTPRDATVAMEPIGYIGYTSGRRVLDEVGLVSPQMIPINRAGDGWFARMLRAFEPEYVVERPYFLEKNETINVKRVRMFQGVADRRWFEMHYEPVAYFRPRVEPFAPKSYHFTIFRRKTAKSSIRRSKR
jgi:hypothetical protein